MVLVSYTHMYTHVFLPKYIYVCIRVQKKAQ